MDEDLLALLGAGGGAYLAKEGYDRLGKIGEQAYEEMGQLGRDLESRYQFQPYSVFTPTGGMFYAGEAPSAQPGYRPVPGSGGFLPPPDPTMAYSTQGGATATPALGETPMDPVGFSGTSPFSGMSSDDLRRLLPKEMPPMPSMPPQGAQFGAQLSPEEMGFYRTLMGGSAGMFGRAMEGPEAREQAVFDRMQAAISPAQERERLALEERLAAQGRLGVGTNMFGGTPEALTLAKAQEEARNQAMLSAMEFAGAEQA